LKKQKRRGHQQNKYQDLKKKKNKEEAEKILEQIKEKKNSAEFVKWLEFFLLRFETKKKDIDTESQDCKEQIQSSTEEKCDG
jgi:hypothetical protein